MDQTSPIISMHGVVPTAEEILQEMWREVGRLDPGLLPARPLSQRIPPQVPVQVDDWRIGLPLPLDSLVALDGVAFVRAAYATVLGRLPDEAGEAALSAAVSSGSSKVAVLQSLSVSPEGRASGRVVPGLRARARVQGAYRIPVVGLLARAGTAMLRRAGVSRAFAAIAELLHGPAMLKFEMDSKLASFGARVEALHTTQLQLGQAHEAALAEAEERFRAQIDGLARQIEAARRADKQALQQLTGRLDALNRKLALQPERLAQTVLTLQARLDEQQPKHDALAERLDQTAFDFQTRLHERQPAYDALAAQTESAIADIRLGIAAQQHRITGFLAELQQADPARAIAILAREDDHSLDELYIAFEDMFRGTREDIKARQRVYLPDLAAATAGTPSRPIVDVGCGRGELLELLRDEGLSARGVDLNGAMAEFTRSIGLDVTTGDAVAFLQALPLGCLGAVTGFHIIEHLPYRVMVDLLDAALRALAPGGVVIFETPNPNNLLVASRYFYMDPTHRNPLPNEMVGMIAKARGFAGVVIRELHPMATHFVAEDALLGEQLDQLFHGCMDYALIARKP